MAAHDPELWHDFAVAFVGGAGALLGLAFVAISFNLDAILENESLPGRAIGTLLCFAYPFAGGLLVLVPGLSLHELAVGQAILAAIFIRMILADIPRWRRRAALGEPITWRLSHFGPEIAIAILSTVGAIATASSSIGGLYWLAGAMGVATAAGLLNSWVLLVEIKR